MVDILTRDQWGATLALGWPMRLPAVGVHVHHSVTVASGDVSADMRTIERIGAERFGRFSYSFCGHPSGVVGEGAGLTIGAHTSGWNSTTLGYCLIGNYELQLVTDAQVQAFLEWRALAVAAGWLAADHWIEPHQARKATACPGANTLARWPELTGSPVPPGPTPPPVQEDDMAIDFVRDARDGAIYLVENCMRRRHLADAEHLDHMQAHLAAKGFDTAIQNWSPGDIDRIPVVGASGED